MNRPLGVQFLVLCWGGLNPLLVALTILGERGRYMPPGTGTLSMLVLGLSFNAAYQLRMMRRAAVPAVLGFAVLPVASAVFAAVGSQADWWDELYSGIMPAVASIYVIRLRRKGLLERRGVG
jgi:hypothetical protein